MSDREQHERDQTEYIEHLLLKAQSRDDILRLIKGFGLRHVTIWHSGRATWDRIDDRKTSTQQ